MELCDITPGPDTKPDYAEAAKWYQRAADAGDGEAAKRLAGLTAQGRAGSDTDMIIRLQRASDLTNRQARLELAFRYWKGEAKPRNAEDAPMELMRSFVRAGDSEAMLRMADLYRTGTHVSKDPLQALVLLQGAASRGNPEALERFTDLKEASSQKRAPAAINHGLEAAYPIYLEALHGQTGEPAARIAPQVHEWCLPPQRYPGVHLVRPRCRSRG